MPPETQQPTDGQPPAQDLTGTIKDQSTPPPTDTSTPPKDTTTPPQDPPKDGKTLLNEKDPATGAPEKYADFTAPDGWAEKGWTIDAATLTEALPIFKELGLTQDQAQKLVSFYATTSQKASESSINSVIEQNEKWVADVKADPEIGSKLPQVKATVSKAIDSLGPELSAQFREAMDHTGVGNHPAFIKAFYKLAQKLTEGTHVPGNGPSKFGQTRPGDAPATAARAMYPNLP